MINRFRIAFKQNNSYTCLTIYSMHERRKLIFKLLNRQRVAILPKNYSKNFNLALQLLLLLILSLTVIYLFSSRLTFSKLIISSIVVLLSLGFYSFCIKKIKETIIKGDTLILNSLGKKSKVTSLRSIKNVKTRSFAGLQYTNLKYTLDGKKEMVVFIGRSSYLPFSPENTIKEAVKFSKKRKANSPSFI